MSKKARRRISALMGVLLLCYVANQIIMLNKAEISTEMATYATVEDTIDVRGFAVRDETLIDSSGSGVLAYCVADGDRVAKDEAIANVYENSSQTSIKNQIEQVTNELDMLKSLTGSVENYAADPGVVNELIYHSLDDILLNVNRFNFSDLHNQRDKFQLAINRKNLITGLETEEDYQTHINELQQELAELESQAVEPKSVITSPSAGYFISNIDGFENIVDINEVSELMPSQVNEILETKIEVTDNKSMGKICQEFKWYIVCVLTEDEAVGLEGLSSVLLEIPFATTQQIPAKIVARNQDSETGEVAVVFSCMNMDADIARIRSESLQIIIQTYSGVLVNEDSIYFNDVEYEEVDESGNKKTVVKENVKGVYIVENDQLKFVQIYSYRTINGYAICKIDLSDEEKKNLYTDKTISLYDKVVSRTNGLYDGMTV